MNFFRAEGRPPAVFPDRRVGFPFANKLPAIMNLSTPFLTIPKPPALHSVRSIASSLFF